MTSKLSRDRRVRVQRVQTCVLRVAVMQLQVRLPLLFLTQVPLPNLVSQLFLSELLVMVQRLRSVPAFMGIEAILYLILVESSVEVSALKSRGVLRVSVVVQSAFAFVE